MTDEQQPKPVTQEDLAQADAQYHQAWDLVNKSKKNREELRRQYEHEQALQAQQEASEQGIPSATVHEQAGSQEDAQLPTAPSTAYEQGLGEELPPPPPPDPLDEGFAQGFNQGNSNQRGPLIVDLTRK